MKRNNEYYKTSKGFWIFVPTYWNYFINIKQIIRRFREQDRFLLFQKKKLQNDKNREKNI